MHYTPQTWTTDAIGSHMHDVGCRRIIFQPIRKLIYIPRRNFVSSLSKFKLSRKKQIILNDNNSDEFKWLNFIRRKNFKASLAFLGWESTKSIQSHSDSRVFFQLLSSHCLNSHLITVLSNLECTDNDTAFSRVISH